jgi:hypothetical protein
VWAVIGQLSGFGRVWIPVKKEVWPALLGPTTKQLSITVLPKSYKKAVLSHPTKQVSKNESKKHASSSKLKINKVRV